MAQINRLKVVLVEQNRTGKWLAEILEKNEATVSRWCTSQSIECRCERFTYFDKEVKTVT